MENKTIDFKKEAENAIKSKNRTNRTSDMFEKIMSGTKKDFVETGGKLMPCIYMLFYNTIHDEYKTGIFPMLATNDEEKGIFAMIIKEMIKNFTSQKDIELLGVVTSLECYVSQQNSPKTPKNLNTYTSGKDFIKPSEDPKRKEALCFTFEQEFTSRSVMWEFMKTDAGEVVIRDEAFIDNVIPYDENLAGGSFSFLFTKKGYSSN